MGQAGLTIVHEHFGFSIRPDLPRCGRLRSPGSAALWRLRSPGSAAKIETAIMPMGALIRVMAVNPD
jgi:hypothetical protein